MLEMVKMVNFVMPFYHNKLKNKLPLESLWNKRKNLWGKHVSEFVLRPQIIDSVSDFMSHTMSKENKFSKEDKSKRVGAT